jgi:hypothetical protein
MVRDRCRRAFDSAPSNAAGWYALLCVPLMIAVGPKCCG